VWIASDTEEMRRPIAIVANRPRKHGAGELEEKKETSCRNHEKKVSFVATSLMTVKKEFYCYQGRP
jgi:hypothetical protein